MNELVEALNGAIEESPLSIKARSELPNSAFAIPTKRKYPIHDENHARNALARVSKFGTEDEKEQVRAAVHRRYPDIGSKKESTEAKPAPVVEKPDAELREVEIARRLLSLKNTLSSKAGVLSEVDKLATELLAIHGLTE
jgi:hypothetical protein